MKSCLGLIAILTVFLVVIGGGGLIWYLSDTVEFSRKGAAAVSTDHAPKATPVSPTPNTPRPPQAVLVHPNPNVPEFPPHALPIPPPEKR